ncbi:MAG TPA: transcriptional regulator [Pseudonocardiaceae bacterium]|nr:transcriptional regulator [Pseudonocardiaceae bacterium]
MSFDSGFGRALADASALNANATLRVDRSAIPHLRRVFDGAMSKLDAQIEIAMTGIRVSPWAGDPVSEAAANTLNDHSVDGADSALDALRAYQRQLKSASDALSRVAAEYQIVESGNTDSFRTQNGC